MFQNQISSISFALIILGLSYIEVKKLNNLITPFTVSALPFVVIILLVNFVISPFGILTVTIRAQYFILFCLLLIWIVGQFFVHNNIEVKNSIDYNPFKIFENFKEYRYIVSFLAYLIALITLWRVRELVSANGGLFYLGTQEYEDEIVKGPVAHIIVFGKSLFIFLYLISKNSKGKIFTYTALFVLGLSIFSLMVKYHLLWLIMIVFFINNYNKPIRSQFKSILKIFVLLLTVFIFYFFILTLLWDTFSVTNIVIWEFFFKTILNYALTGPIVLDMWLDNPSIKPQWTFLTFPLNLMYVIFGDPQRIGTVENVSMGFYNVGMDIWSNVGTSFGVYYLIGGFPFVIFFTILFAIASYYFFMKGLKSHNYYYSFLAWFFLALNTLNFFVQFFTLLSFYQFPVFFFILVIIFKLVNKFYYSEKKQAV